MVEEKKIEIQKWKNFISQNVRGKITQKALNQYVQNLILNNTVVILDFNHLAKLLGIRKGILSNILMKLKSVT